MHIFVSIFISALLSVLCYFLVTHTKKTLERITASKRLGLPVKEIVFPNSFQSICVYNSDSMNTVQKAVSTITLRTSYDPYSLLFTDRRSSFHANLILSHRAPCFYVNKKGHSNAHVGSVFSKPFLLNKSRYSVSGNVTDKLHDFLCKHDLEYFYSSYLPARYNEVDCKYSHVELETSLDNVDGEFLDDFLNIFHSVEHESENKYQRIIKEFDLARRQYKNEEGIMNEVKKALAARKSK